MGQSKKLFGTDGFRGRFSDSDDPNRVNATSFANFAEAYTRQLRAKHNASPAIIIGGDTRTSGENLRAAVADGARRGGAHVLLLGIAPTPVIAWLAQEYQVAAIAVTASHNPDADNGFKPFAVGGTKLSRTDLDDLERRYWQLVHTSAKPISGSTSEDASKMINEYLVDVSVRLGGADALAGTLLVVDGANGAAYQVAPKLYRALGAEVVEFACDPEQGIINDGCGAAHLEGLKKFLKEHPEITSNKHFLGALAHDGDADRVMGITAQGDELNGNHWLRYLAEGQPGIVGTLYSNSGLRQTIETMGVAFHESANGDAQVTEKLQQLGLQRGGEATGHLIDLQHLPSGDGLYMGAWLAIELTRRGQDFQTAYDNLRLWPELLQNVQLERGDTDTHAIAINPSILATERRLQTAADNKLRIIVRASGTEPLIRIWAEAEDESAAQAAVTELADKISQLTKERV